MDPQFTTEEPTCNLSNGSPMFVGGCLFWGAGLTHDGVLDEELFLEIVANLVRGHDGGWPIGESTRQKRVCNTERTGEHRVRRDPVGRLERSSEGI